MCTLIQTDGDKTYYLCIRKFNSLNFISVIKETKLTGCSLFPVMEKRSALLSSNAIVFQPLPACARKL